jgi:hypothetical protein
MIRFDARVAQNALNGLIMSGRVTETEIQKVASAAEAFFDKLKENTHDEVVPVALVEANTEKPSVFDHPSFPYASPKARASAFNNILRGLPVSKQIKKSMKEFYQADQAAAYRALMERVLERDIAEARNKGQGPKAGRFFGLNLVHIPDREKSKFLKIREMVGVESALVAMAEFCFAKEYPWAT